MPKSIKNKIMDAVLALMEPLKADGTFRGVEREVDFLLMPPIRPWLQIYDGGETLTGKDSRGRTYQFPLVFKLIFEAQRDAGSVKDALVPKVQQIIESNIQLGGLCILIDGGEELPIVDETHKPVCGAILTYSVDYRRMRGDPYTTY